MHSSEKTESQTFDSVTDNWSCINSHDFIIIFFSAYHAHFLNLKYALSYQSMPSILLLPWPRSLMHIYTTNIYVNANTVNSHIEFAKSVFFATSICSTIYHITLSEQVILIHPVNKCFHMFKCSSYIMNRVIWKMWVKIYPHHSLIYYIILVFILILTDTDLYWESQVEAKFLWINFHVKFYLQCFIIIMFYHNIIIVNQKSSLLICLHLFLPSKKKHPMIFILR